MNVRWLFVLVYDSGIEWEVYEGDEGQGGSGGNVWK